MSQKPEPAEPATAEDVKAEIAAVHAVYHSLLALTPEGRLRVIDYVRDSLAIGRYR